ncbi:uncharacterized protein LOC110674673 [Aedes aegypti]|uniref:Uncharacterized protein n=1 Tax=Aedes aegypti TaxID=7159 RepID=A0A6I8U325_AEDAE|nr:uncharacterized protein LOC110674673 [Aedes aegypti]
MDVQVFPISDLPVELLQHIFSFLPLSDRKSASLVCHLWEEVAFGVRLMRNVALEIRVWCNLQLTYLRRSSRRYRNVFVHLDPVNRRESHIKFVLEVLDLLGAHLESFQCLAVLRVEQLLHIVIRLPNLQHLVVGLDASTLTRQKLDFPAMKKLRFLGSLTNVLQIKSLNVPKLTDINVVFTSSVEGRESIPILQRLASQLKKVELFSVGYFTPIEELRFPNAELLNIGGRFCEAGSESALRAFFSGFSVLKDVKLDFAVSELVLDLITKACPGIESLHLKIRQFGPDSFRWMERLKCLKTLSMGGIDDTLSNINCKPLVSVKRLSLEMSGCSPNFMKGLRLLLPNVTTMTVTLTGANVGWWLELICLNFRQLRQLTISDEIDRDRMLASSLLSVGQLEQLEELTFKNVRTRVVFMPANPRLRRLVIDHPHWLNNGDLLELAKRYPNLKYLELGSGREVTDAGIKKLRSLLKDCVVHCPPSCMNWGNVLTVYRDVFEIPLHIL